MSGELPRECFDELGIEITATLADAKAAFRRAALRFHPDRGGDAQQFIRAYTAYRQVEAFLCSKDSAAGGGTESGRLASEEAEPVEELTERLEMLDAAFGVLLNDVRDAATRWVQEIFSRVAPQLSAATSCSQVDSVVKRTLKYLRTEFPETVTTQMQGKVDAIADGFDSWMRSWLVPYYVAVRREHARRWRVSPAAGICSLSGLVLGVCIGGELSGWAGGALGAAAGLLVGWLLSYPVHLAVGAMCYGAEASEARVSAPSVAFDRERTRPLRDVMTDEEYGMTGAAMGLYALGPWGAMLGLLLGSAAGAAFGQHVDERRRVAAQILDKAVRDACGDVQRALMSQLGLIKEQMRGLVEDAYRSARSRAASCIGLLPRPPSHDRAGDDSPASLEDMYQRGMRYALGEGVPRDPTEAVRCLRRAAEGGHFFAQYNLGACYADGTGVARDPVQAARWFRKAATDGFPPAQRALAVCYLLGDGVVKDDDAGVVWARRAAELGDADAELLLGLHYRDGDAAAKDAAESVRWLRTAADHGVAEAQYLLGTALADGEGVAVDQTEAVHWFRLAATRGHAKAQCMLGGAYAEGAGVPKDAVEAARWFRTAANQGSEYGQCVLGRAYADGIGVPQDKAEAARWYRAAADQGLAEAQYRVGLAYGTGMGVVKDLSESQRWIRKAAEQGHAEAAKLIAQLAPH